VVDRLDQLPGQPRHDSYRNGISRLTANVLRRFLDPAPFAMPLPDRTIAALHSGTGFA
jgi:hypothetical protein